MKYILFVIYSLYILIFLSIFTFIYIILSNIRNKKIQEKLDQMISMKGEYESNTNSYSKFNNYLKKKNGYFSYDRINDYLNSLGNPLDLTPAAYIIAKFSLALITFISFLTVNTFLALIGCLIAFFIIDICFRLSDKKDMKSIKLELSDVYDLINIQVSAGVFVGTALTEAYLIVTNKRFKKSLTLLSAEIAVTNNIESALDKFSKSFRSIEIDTFVMTIKQSFKTGRIQQAIEDSSNSLKEVNQLIIQEQTNRINTQKNFIQLAMYLGIIFVILYGLMIELSNSFSGILSQ